MNDYTFEQYGTRAGLISIEGLLWILAGIAALAAIVFLLKRYLDKKRKWSLFLENQDFSKLVYNVSHNITGSDFEIWVQQLLLSVGIQSKVIGGRGDHGIDVIAHFNGKKIGIQCKKYYMKRGTLMVGEPVLRDLYGVKFADGYDKVVAITTGNFSPEALEWAKGKPGLVLINAKILERIILNRGLLKEILQ
jgi:HJR/Mrr/RecB family endonuclease